MTAPHVLLLTQEHPTVAAVRSVLQSRAPAGDVAVCETMMDLRTHLSREPGGAEPRLALVDIDPDPERVLAELGKLTSTYPRTWFVAVSQEFDERHVLHAMQAGVRHFLRKSTIPTELDGVLQRLLAQGPRTAARLGTIVSVLACSGGCGATTAAINLANELRLATDRRVLVVDLDTHYGAAASYLGVKGRYGIGHVLARAGAIDRHVIESTAVTYGPGFDLLLSPAVTEADTAAPLDYDNLPAALEACREAYDYIVVDAPRVPRQVVADVAAASRVSVIVLQLTVRDVGVASELITFLAERGIPRERLWPLANRVRRRGPLLRLEDSRRAIGIHALHPVRSDWARAMKSVNRGQPLSEVAGRSGLRRDYRRLAARIRKCTSNGSLQSV